MDGRIIHRSDHLGSREEAAGLVPAFKELVILWGTSGQINISGARGSETWLLYAGHGMQRGSQGGLPGGRSSAQEASKI